MTAWGRTRPFGAMPGIVCEASESGRMGMGPHVAEVPECDIVRDEGAAQCALRSAPLYSRPSADLRATHDDPAACGDLLNQAIGETVTIKIG